MNNLTLGSDEDGEGMSFSSGQGSKRITWTLDPLLESFYFLPWSCKMAIQIFFSGVTCTSWSVLVVDPCHLKKGAELLPNGAINWNSWHPDIVSNGSLPVGLGGIADNNCLQLLSREEPEELLYVLHSQILPSLANDVIRDQRHALYDEIILVSHVLPEICKFRIDSNLFLTMDPDDTAPAQAPWRCWPELCCPYCWRRTSTGEGAKSLIAALAPSKRWRRNSSLENVVIYTLFVVLRSWKSRQKMKIRWLATTQDLGVAV